MIALTSADQARIEGGARTDQLERFMLAFRFCVTPGDGVISDQVARAANLIHDLVTGIDAKSALDAFELRAVTDVDAGGADDDAGLAVDAVAAIVPALVLALGPARFASFRDGS